MRERERERASRLKLVFVVAGYALAGCNQTSFQSEGSTDAARETIALVTASEEPEGDFSGDGVSDTAVTLAWHEPASAKHAAVFPVLVKNTTTQTQTVELQITGSSPENEPLEQPLTSFNLPPNSTRVVPIKLDDMPVQSSGSPGGMRVAARYATSGASAEAPRFVVFTEPLMVTFDADFKAATARTAPEQMRVNTRVSTEVLLGRRGEVRLKDARTSAYRARSTTASGPIGPVVMLPASADIDFANAGHAEDTETLRGDQ
jgi:hypothetical protein